MICVDDAAHTRLTYCALESLTMTSDSTEPPQLPEDWHKAAQAVASALGLADSALADAENWARILQSVEQTMRNRGIDVMPDHWQETLARDVGRH